jgi:hypothetical protein
VQLLLGGVLCGVDLVSLFPVFFLGLVPSVWIVCVVPLTLFCGYTSFVAFVAFFLPFFVTRMPPLCSCTLLAFALG